MQLHLRTLLSSAVVTALAYMPNAYAGTDTWFTPLTESAPVTAPNSYEEINAPWVAPGDIHFKNLINMRTIEDEIAGKGQSVLRSLNSGRSASMFDMIAYSDDGRYLFIPHETPWGAGASRYDMWSGKNMVIFQGDGAGEMCQFFEPEEPRDPTDTCPYWKADYAAFDPARFTPNGTVFLGEEWSGEGRIIEILNPLADPEEIEYRELNSIANVAHEGINFSKKYSDTIYYIDEWRSGSIYKFVMKTPGDYTVGQTFVLVVDDFVANGGTPEDYYNEGNNLLIRTGMATWVPITDADGNYTTAIDPFRNGPTNDPRTEDDTRGGRPAADEVNGTPFGRPEDMEVGMLNGNEVIYFTATSENSVYAVEMLEDNKANVKLFATGLDDFGATPTNLGHAPTTGSLNSPDNLAQDALGNIYIIEDAPNGSDTGGDIWLARDADNDGVAESLDHFLSIRVDGSEATGMIFNPAKPTEFVVAVQHPDSTSLGNPNAVVVTDPATGEPAEPGQCAEFIGEEEYALAPCAGGYGDAVWKFKLDNIENQAFVKRLKWTQLVSKLRTTYSRYSR